MFAFFLGRYGSKPALTGQQVEAIELASALAAAEAAAKVAAADGKGGGKGGDKGGRSSGGSDPVVAPPLTTFVGGSPAVAASGDMAASLAVREQERSVRDPNLEKKKSVAPICSGSWCCTKISRWWCAFPVASCSLSLSSFFLSYVLPPTTTGLWKAFVPDTDGYWAHGGDARGIIVAGATAQKNSSLPSSLYSSYSSSLPSAAGGGAAAAASLSAWHPAWPRWCVRLFFWGTRRGDLALHVSVPLALTVQHVVTSFTCSSLHVSSLFTSMCG